MRINRRKKHLAKSQNSVALDRAGLLSKGRELGFPGFMTRWSNDTLRRKIKEAGA